MPRFGLTRHKVRGPTSRPPVPERIPQRPPEPGGLRVAFLVYRGNPRAGARASTRRHLTRELVALGHSVEVFAGQPWPEVDEGVGFTPVPSLDLYREPDPFRIPQPTRVHRLVPESIAPSSSRSCARPGSRSPGPSACGPGGCWRRAVDEFDLVHDNQCLGHGHPGDDRRRVAGARRRCTTRSPSTGSWPSATPTNPWQQITQRRWFGFLRMQVRVARSLPRIVTVSESSKTDIAAQMGVDHRPDDRGPGRGRPHRVPARGPTSTPVPRADHGHLLVRRPHEGSGPAARGGGQAPHRARRRARRDRQPARRRPGGPGHRAARPLDPSCGA